MINYWSVGDDEERLTHERADAAIEEYLDGIDPGHWPEELELAGWSRAELSPETCGAGPAEQMLEWLDEEYGDPDGGPTEITDTMRAAEARFIEAVLAEYFVWRCEITERRTVVVADWVREHRPDWLEKT